MVAQRRKPIRRHCANCGHAATAHRSKNGHRHGACRQAYCHCPSGDYTAPPPGFGSLPIIDPIQKELTTALEDLLQVITNDELIPESVSYMKQARAALAKAKSHPPITASKGAA
jgi:hypothetical protein